MNKNSGHKSSPPCPLGFNFIITELSVFVSQIFIFFTVAAFSSDFLRNEDRLTEYVTAKVNTNTMPEIGLTLLAVTVALGVLFFISRIASTPFIEKISNEVLNEAPRTIYFFGSSISATTLAVSIFLAYHPDPTHGSRLASNLFWTSVFFASVAFVYGCGINYLLKCQTLKRQ